MYAKSCSENKRNGQVQICKVEIPENDVACYRKLCFKHKNKIESRKCVVEDKTMCVEGSKTSASSKLKAS